MLLRLFLATVCLLGPLKTAQAAITATGNVTPATPATWNSSTIGFIGDTGYGEITVASGSDLSSLFGGIGLNSNSTGVVTVTGNGSTWTSEQGHKVGIYGKGTLNIAGGGVVVSNIYPSLIGSNVGSTGIATVDGSGSMWTNNAPFTIGGTGFTVGYYGSGTLNITGGGTVSNTTFGVIGDYAGSTGVVTVGGISSTWTNRTLGVGRVGNATLNIIGGGAVSNAESAYIASPGSTSAVTVIGNGSTWTNGSALAVGFGGNGTLNIKGGGKVSNTVGTIGTGLAGVGLVTVDGSGSTWTNSEGLRLGVLYNNDIGIGTLNITHGGAVTATSAWIDNQSLLAVDTGSILNVGSGSFTNNGTVRISAAANAAAGTYTPILAGTWSGSGAYQALGGMWNTSNHQFTVSDAHPGTSGETVTMDPSTAPRVVFSGVGSTGVVRSVGASFAASGASGSTLSFAATMIDDATRASLESILGGSPVLDGWKFTPISGYIQGSPVYLTFDVGAGFSKEGLRVWHNHDGSWSTYAPNDLTYDGRYASFTVNGFSTWLLTATPEPSTIALLASGAASLLVLAWRRRKR